MSLIIWNSLYMIRILNIPFQHLNLYLGYPHLARYLQPMERNIITSLQSLFLTLTAIMKFLWNFQWGLKRKLKRSSLYIAAIRWRRGMRPNRETFWKSSASRQPIHSAWGPESKFWTIIATICISWNIWEARPRQLHCHWIIEATYYIISHHQVNYSH